jgi:D-alanine-D-alanine ligase
MTPTATPRTNDPKAFGRVAVLMGGTSAEREVSLDSGRNVLEALLARGVDAHVVDGIPALLEALLAKEFDRVFNILHGNKGGGEDGTLQGLLEALGVPYTGSGVLGSALGMDKIRTKQVWLSLGLPTPRYVRLAPGADAVHGLASVAGGRMPGATVQDAARELGLPVIVKPSCEGSSVGVSRVFNDADLDAAVALAARYPGELLMEQLIVGGEYTVGILGDVALPSIRIVPAGEYYDYHAKYQAEDTQYLCPGLEGADELAIRELSLAAFRAAGCTGWGRVDVMRDAAGNNYLLEVNTAPGMTSHSLVPKAARQVGISFEDLCWLVLETSLPKEGATP